jgi:hypothetical protein
MTGAYEAAVSYRDSIVTLGQMLAGDEPADEPMDWQAMAQRQARELRRYAQFLDDCAEGRVRGPIVFPSWKEE